MYTSGAGSQDLSIASILLTNSSGLRLPSPDNGYVHSESVYCLLPKLIFQDCSCLSYIFTSDKSFSWLCSFGGKSHHDDIWSGKIENDICVPHTFICSSVLCVIYRTQLLPCQVKISKILQLIMYLVTFMMII